MPLLLPSASPYVHLLYVHTRQLMNEKCTSDTLQVLMNREFAIHTQTHHMNTIQKEFYALNDYYSEEDKKQC